MGQEARLSLNVTVPLCPKASVSSSQSTVHLGHWVETELMSINVKSKHSCPHLKEPVWISYATENDLQ